MYDRYNQQSSVTSLYGQLGGSTEDVLNGWFKMASTAHHTLTLALNNLFVYYLRFKSLGLLFAENRVEGGALQAAVRGAGGGVPDEGAGGAGGSPEGAEGGCVLAGHLEDQALLLRLLPGETAQGSPSPSPRLIVLCCALLAAACSVCLSLQLKSDACMSSRSRSGLGDLAQ